MATSLLSLRIASRLEFCVQLSAWQVKALPKLAIKEGRIQRNAYFVCSGYPLPQDREARSL